MDPVLEFPEPSSCAYWHDPSPVLDNQGQLFDTVETFLEDEHAIRRLLRCRECGQLYFYKFYEIVDWADGDDSQYREFIPVADRPSIEALKASTSTDLQRSYPSLHLDWPKGEGATIYWVNGPSSHPK